MHTEYLTLQEQKQKRLKSIGIWVISTAVVLLAAWGVVKMAQSSKETLSTVGVVPGLSASDKIQGNRNAKVVFYEYADYQCPACQQLDPVLKQILRDYPNDVALVYRNFPLIRIH